MTRLVRAGAPLLLLAVLLAVPLASSAQDGLPTTEFEDSGGATWTTFEGEQAFMEEVAAASPRVGITELGRTLEDRPLQLVTLGEPGPRTLEQIRAEPSVLLVCSVHGNEPAGREACLIAIRDLAFTQDPELVALLRTTTVLVVPAANPDGRANGTRENTEGTDVNRDHLGLTSAEARAIATVLRDHQPDATVDLHEYGPGQPVAYDDDVLVLWPRNLNVDREVYDLAYALAQDWIAAGVEEAGYTADEYGLMAIGDTDVTQTAGDEDEGILRNQGGLRHSLGILVETAVSPRLLNPVDPSELDSAVNQTRRVTAHRQVITEVLAFLAAEGTAARDATAGSRERKAAEGRDRSAPLYLGGQEQDSTVDGSGPGPTAEETIDPPPCAYRLTPAHLEVAGAALDLHGVRSVADPGGDGVLVPLGQEAEPVIALLLDPRGARSLFAGQDDAPVALDDCAGLPLDPAGAVVDRVAGPGRVETAAAIAQIAGGGGDVVVVATATGYADALAAGPLARSLDAALLLSRPDALSPAAAEEITRRGATEAVVVGGEAALSHQVVSDLEALDLQVRRLGGASRFDTAGMIFDALGEGTDAVVVEGEHELASRGWPDALVGAALSAAGDRGLLLVNRDHLPEATAQRLEGLASATIVGGEQAVSAGVADQVDALAGTVLRLAGPTRYASSAVAADAVAAQIPPDVVWLATGRDWPDGLVAGSTGTVLLLIDGTDPAGSPETLAWLEAHAGEIASVHLAGGESAIARAVEEAVRRALSP